MKEKSKYGTASYAVEPKSDANCLTKERVDEVKPEPKFKVSERVYSTTLKHDVIILEILPNCFYNVADTRGLGWFKTHENTLCKDVTKPTDEYTLPEGYIFKDENGNVLKIVLEKKKKECPKTYEECCKVLNIAVRDLDILDNMLDTTEIIYSKNLDRLLNSFRKLIICRDAYWKIAGDEMGLGKPWEPCDNKVFGIISQHSKIQKYNDFVGGSTILEFPTEEMRDAFKENFKEEIEICKELL